MEKREIRTMVREIRQKLSPDDIEEKSRIICEKATKLSCFLESESVYAYADCRGEVSVRHLLETAWMLGKKTAVPKVEGENMNFYYISSYDDLAEGYYGIPEPVSTSKGELTAAKDEDALLIMPGVGFDPKRNRCGYGKGFYDRYLKMHPSHLSIAMAFDFQIVDNIPSGPYDIRPSVLITETRFY